MKCQTYLSKSEQSLRLFWDLRLISTF